MYKSYYSLLHYKVTSVSTLTISDKYSVMKTY